MAILIEDGRLTIEDVVKVARNFEKIELTQNAVDAVNKARDYVEEKLDKGEIIYGLTTGFGKFSDKFIPKEDTATLQRNLIISHSCGMGNPYPTEVVRGAMLLRVNALARGNSGIRLSTLMTLVNMLNKGVHPIIPEKGSLGASGDLAPLSHIVLVMLGEGEAEYEGVRMSGKEAMDKAGIETIELSAKEGLALINGTQIMTSMAALLCHDAKLLAKTADIAVCMTGEALNAITKAYDPKVHEVRGHKGQIDAAANMLKILSDSKNCARVQPGKVQDAYSLRCAPQVHGASRDAIEYVYAAVEREINAVTDNPLVFSDDDDVISAGNFHGQPMALAMDFLAIALAEYANISERRTERLVNPQLSAGLPAFLTADGGVNSGFMIVQYSAASMVSESKVYCHPASVDSIPSSANQEDHVSMGTTAARKARLVLDNSQKVVGIELFCASQGIYFRGEDKLGTATKAVYDHIRKSVKPVKEDRVMYTELAKFDAMVKNGEIVNAVENAIGQLR